MRLSSSVEWGCSFLSQRRETLTSGSALSGAWRREIDSCFQAAVLHYLSGQCLGITDFRLVLWFLFPELPGLCSPAALLNSGV